MSREGGAAVRGARRAGKPSRAALQEQLAACERELARMTAVRSILTAASRDFSHATPDLRTLLDTIARRLAESVGDAAVVRLVTPDGRFLEPVAVHHETEEGRQIIWAVQNIAPLPVDLPNNESVMKRGETQYLPVVDPSFMATHRAIFSPEQQALLDRFGMHSLVRVPLRAESEIVGVLSVLRSRPGNPLSPEDVQLIEDLGVRASLALTNARLFEQRRNRTAELEAAVRELEAFNYSASHDLRTPLRALDGYSLALLEDYGDRLDAPGRHYLERIRVAAQRMGALIDDLLRLSRITRAELHRETVDLGELAQDILGQLLREEPSRRVEWRVEPGLVVEADPGLLRVALENLLANAWKFTRPRACGHLEIGRHGDVFYVKDDGAGFDPRFTERLFKPFQRLHSPREFEGTGVGLATVQRIVERHGGRVWAESAPEQGATFHFTLPNPKGQP